MASETDEPSFSPPSATSRLANAQAMQQRAADEAAATPPTRTLVIRSSAHAALKAQREAQRAEAATTRRDYMYARITYKNVTRTYEEAGPAMFQIRRTTHTWRIAHLVQPGKALWVPSQEHRHEVTITALDWDDAGLCRMAVVGKGGRVPLSEIQEINEKAE